MLLISFKFWEILETFEKFLKLLKNLNFFIKSWKINKISNILEKPWKIVKNFSENSQIFGGKMWKLDDFQKIVKRGNLCCVGLDFP